MDDKKTTSFGAFLKFYTVMFLVLLVVAVSMTFYNVLTFNYSDAGETSRSALIFAALLWLGRNIHRLDERLS